MKQRHMTLTLEKSIKHWKLGTSNLILGSLPNGQGTHVESQLASLGGKEQHEQDIIFMKKFSIYLTIVTLFTFTAFANAAGNEPCEKQISERIGGHFKISNFHQPNRNDLSGVILASACKIWPKDGKTLIAAFAYANDGASVDEADELNLLVTLSNEDGTQVLSSLTDKIYQDASLTLRSDSLEIDTARYDLSSSTRAFGLRLHNSNQVSYADSEWNNFLTLYVPEGNRLRSVLKDVPTWGYQRIDEENAEIWTTTIAIGKSSHHGFRDLVLRNRYFMEYDGPTIKRSTRIFMYNGNEYISTTSSDTLSDSEH